MWRRVRTWSVRTRRGVCVVLQGISRWPKLAGRRRLLRWILHMRRWNRICWPPIRHSRCCGGYCTYAVEIVTFVFCGPREALCRAWVPRHRPAGHPSCHDERRLGLVLQRRWGTSASLAAQVSAHCGSSIYFSRRGDSDGRRLDARCGPSDSIQRWGGRAGPRARRHRQAVRAGAFSRELEEENTGPWICAQTGRGAHRP